MTSAPRIRYFGGGDVSGYGLAAVANVRLLVNAGVPVEWIPLDWFDQGFHPVRWFQPDGASLPVLRLCGDAGALADLPTLIERTARPVDHDTVIVHSPPEAWPVLFEPGKFNVGCVAWETDRMPAHWLPLMRRADRVLVPCEANRAAFRRSGLGVPIRVIPHVRRHSWCEYSPLDLSGARDELGIPAHHLVYYSINSWNPRKNLVGLIQSFAGAFSAGEPVTLLIKTEAQGHDMGPLYPLRPTQQLATEAITAAAQHLQRPVPQVILHDDDLDGPGIDLIHAISDVYVSLSRGEGWGLGAFEAATLGKPVIMTGWGGHTEFLGPDWPGAIPYRMEPAWLWPPQRPSYFPSQRWAEPDLAVAGELMRNLLETPGPARVAAKDIRERLFRDYAEPVLARDWLATLGG